MKNKRKNKQQTEKQTLTTILLVVGISAFAFTAAMIVLFIMFQQVPDTLVERFYTCVVGECGIAGIIQVVKTIFKNKKSSNTDDDCASDCDENNIGI